MPQAGEIWCWEVPDGKVGELSIRYTVIGEVTDRGTLEYGNAVIPMEEALQSWTKTLEDVFPTESRQSRAGRLGAVPDEPYQADSIYICSHKIGQPQVFIPRYSREPTVSTTAQQLLSVPGRRLLPEVFRNLSAEDIRDSVEGIQERDRKSADRYVPRRLLSRG